MKEGVNMNIDRREFLGVVPATAAIAAWRSARPRADTDDPLGVRGDFPITRDEIFLNSAYIAPPPTVVEEAGVSFIRSKTHRPISLGDMLAKTDEVRSKFARLVRADDEEVGFFFATSEGENVVARSIGLQPGDNVVIDELHYDTTFVLYRHLEETLGIELRIAKHSGGAVRPETFEPLMDERTRLLSVAWVSHQNGFRHDMKALAKLAHAHGAYLYTDAIQAVGMFPMDLHEEGVDFLTSGTYKWLLAAYGVAPFYIRRDLLGKVEPDRLGALHVEKELDDYRYQIYSTAKKFEYATLAFGPVYQLGAALDYLQKVGVDRIEAHTVGLAHKLRRGLVELGCRVSTPEGNRSSIVTFEHDKNPEEVSQLLDKEKIRVSLREGGAQIRVGIALFNNESEIEHLLAVLRQLA
jgi:selenocysteine lyase/cysteine desulfurase